MAEPPASASAHNLRRLPDDLLRQILVRIPCAVYRGLVCRAWRDAMVRLLLDLHPPAPLPWLLLRAPAPLRLGLGSTRAACALSGGRVHHFLDVAPPDARCFGSHDGTWLLLHSRGNDARGNWAFNIRTGLAAILPSGLLGLDGEHHDNMVVLATALSSWPDDVAAPPP